jgi:hypothetical protein
MTLSITILDITACCKVECRKEARYAECLKAECRHTECFGVKLTSSQTLVKYCCYRLKHLSNIAANQNWYLPTKLQTSGNYYMGRHNTQHNCIQDNDSQHKGLIFDT